MSDTPPDRKEEGDAPDGPRNPYVRLIAWMFLAPVLYVLSSGPVWWLLEHKYLPEAAGCVLVPLFYLPEGPLRIVLDYMGWWAPMPQFGPWL